MTSTDLQTRLDHLSKRIEAAEVDLKGTGTFSAGHQASTAELRTRYNALTKKVRVEVAEAEANGHHVTDLEQSVRQWLDSLEMEM